MVRATGGEANTRPQQRSDRARSRIAPIVFSLWISARRRPGLWPCASSPTADFVAHITDDSRVGRVKQIDHLS